MEENFLIGSRARLRSELGADPVCAWVVVFYTALVVGLGVQIGYRCVRTIVASVL